MPAKLTASDWGRHFWGLFLFSLVYFGVCGLAAYGITKFAGHALSDSFHAVLFAGFVLINTIVFGRLLIRRYTLGSVLLDCGRNPSCLPLLLFSVCMAAVGVWVVVDRPPENLLSPQGPLLFFAMTFGVMVTATGRLQIKEKGIQGYVQAISWDRIERFCWSDDSTLFIRGRGWAALFFINQIRVPPEQQAEVDALLHRHSPVAAQSLK